MKAIRHILISYLQMEFIQLLNIILGIFYFIVANIKVLTGDGFHEGFFSTWHWFLFSFFLIFQQVQAHTRRLLEFNRINLIPGKLRYHFITTVIILAPFVIWPVILVRLLGLPVLPHFALILFSLSVLILFLFLSIPKMKITDTVRPWEIIFGIILIILAYILLNFPVGDKIPRLWPELFEFGSRFDMSIYIVILSVIFLSLTVFLYLKESKSLKSDLNGILESLSVSGHDRVDSYTWKTVHRKLAGLIENIRSGKPTSMQMTKLFQYGLFNPGSSVFFISMISFALLASIIALILSYISTDRIETVLFYMFPPSVIWLCVYQIDASRLSMEFLRHRTNIPSIWLQSQLSTRKEFVKKILSAYIFVALKRYLTFGFAFLIIALLFPDFYFIKIESIPIILLAGIIQYILMISLSLIFSADVTSNSCYGWTISIVLLCIMTWLIFLVYWHAGPGILTNSIILSAALIVSGFVFREAFKIFTDTEMDFAEP